MNWCGLEINLLSFWVGWLIGDWIKLRWGHVLYPYRTRGNVVGAPREETPQVDQTWGVD